MATAIFMCLMAVFGGVISRPSRGYEEYILEHLPDLLERLQRLDYAEDTSFNVHGPRLDIQWPARDVRVGQVGGIAVDPTTGDVVVFHRGDRDWGYNSFIGDQFNPTLKAITTDTILRLDRDTGRILDSFGANKFYMPHGLTIDKKGNLWLTDVGLHQVMMIPKGSREPSLVLGEALTPGSDNDHFCKPTDVAVASNGDFFVSDGYCNGRIMKFSKDGHYLSQWGKRSTEYKSPDALDNDEFYVPHSLALIESSNVLCVADREHGRIQCFTAGLNNGTDAGHFVRTFNNKEFGKVFAIAYDHNADVIYAVSGVMPNAFLYTIDPAGNILYRTSPSSQLRGAQGFGQPHDVALSPDGVDIYTGEIVPKRVLRFRQI